MTVYHELEPGYLLGEFALRGLEKGLEIVPEKEMQPGPWNKQGYPFLAAGARYTMAYKIAKPTGQYLVQLPKWYGSIARVEVHGREAGHILSKHEKLNVTRLIRAGADRIEVTIMGTLKNTLGPHHGSPAPGTAWPAMFQKAPNAGLPPGDDYSTVGYGLIAPFELIRKE